MNVTKVRAGWAWRTRAGDQMEVYFDVPDASPAALAGARRSAMEMGYPGHKGGWWNYLVDDVCKVAAALRALARAAIEAMSKTDGEGGGSSPD